MCCKSLRGSAQLLTFGVGWPRVCRSRAIPDTAIPGLRVELVPYARICSATHSALHPRPISVVCCLVLALSAACSGSELVFPDGGGTMTIRVVTGNGQSGQVGETLSDPVVVEVTDAAGEPLKDATVEFEFTSAGAGAEILPSSATTDEEGLARAHLRLGDKVGVQSGEARVVLDGATGSKAPFTALASEVSPQNHPPHADFNWHCNDLSCQFSDGSSDEDGSVTGWSWDFGDGGSADQPNPTYSYTEAGTYTVTLTVTDDDGATDHSAGQVEVSVSSPPPPSNQPPHADFDVQCHDRFCSFSDKSRDDDGSVVSRVWDFGDGSGSSDANPFHIYRDEGHYQVTLTVTDDDGAADTSTHDAKVKD
jgi:PKD repeat protein